MRIAALAFAAFVLLTCARAEVDRAEWQAMPAIDRALYVNTLIAAETVKQKKGGGGKTYSRGAEEYVTRIDAAYARGDQRDPHEIFMELAD